MSTTTLKTCIWILAIAACAQLPLWADGSQTGTIDGRVLDPQGGPLPGATVTLEGPQTTLNAITDAKGHYRFSLLTPGPYTVRAELEGLGEGGLAASLQAGARRTLDVTLRSGTGEQITVTAEAPMISKFETAASSTLSAEVTEEMAFATRRHQDMVHQLPGVTSPFGNRSHAYMAIAGGTIGENGTYVEGVDISQTRRGGEFRFQMPTTAFVETTIQSAGRGAEYGRSTSGVINSVVKTGTNQFHGDFIYLGQNTKWRAPYKVRELPRPDKPINSFEASLGGPIWRDKAWFFIALDNSASNTVNQDQNGFIYESGTRAEATIGKVNAQPGKRHQIALTYIDAPRISLAGGASDAYSQSQQTIVSGVNNLSWNFSATPTVFTELKVADSADLLSRRVLAYRVLDPNASIDSPLGNNFRYRDLNDNGRYNASRFGNGDGYNDFPRDQLNAAATVFKGNHELRFGADHHVMEFESLVGVDTEYRGRGYDVNAPGGYAQTQINKRVYVPAPGGVNHVESTMQAVYAQDRIQIGEKWVLTVGLRIDDQGVDNNVGQEVNQYEDLVPRLSAVYDVKADGSLLLRATAGRYTRIFPLDLAFQQFSVGPTGLNIYDQYGWNPATQLYDVFQRHSETVPDFQIPALDPWYKNEVSLGVDWQIAKNWALTSRFTANETEDIWWPTRQFDAAGEVFVDLHNWPEAWREYRGLQFVLKRRMRNNWLLRTNLTVGKHEGNQAAGLHGGGLGDNGLGDSLFEGLGGIELGTGDTDATVRNRVGRIDEDREYTGNVMALKRWETSRRTSLSTSLNARFSAGRRWGLRPNTAIIHPVSGQRINTSTFLEPRDFNQLPDTVIFFTAIAWDFPIRGRYQGKLGFEVTNILNDQAQQSVSVTTGRPSSVGGGYTLPREFRLKVGITF